MYCTYLTPPKVKCNYRWQKNSWTKHETFMKGILELYFFGKGIHEQTNFGKELMHEPCEFDERSREQTHMISFKF